MGEFQHVSQENCEKFCSKYLREELRPLEKKTSDGDCAFTVFHLAGTGVLQASCCGVLQGSPATLSGINPYIALVGLSMRSLLRSARR
jgi:hypothetical protein